MHSWRMLSCWLFFLVITTGGSTQTSTLPSGTTVCTDEDYAIFSAALDDGLAKQKLDGVMVLDHTVPSGYVAGLAGRANLRKESQAFYGLIPRDASDDLEARNRNRAAVDVRKMVLPFAALSFSNEESEKLKHKDGWGTFHDKYPGTVMVAAVSLPGINRERDRAVLYLEAYCGPICGGGTLILLSKDAGKWKVIGKTTTWQS
jgi:hypothetical protein